MWCLMDILAKAIPRRLAVESPDDHAGGNQQPMAAPTRHGLSAMHLSLEPATERLVGFLGLLERWNRPTT